tara:strand:- start:15509 stop:16051 length:543 start_codon:yes stop_codon:yes gene_type:complete
MPRLEAFELSGHWELELGDAVVDTMETNGRGTDHKIHVTKWRQTLRQAFESSFPQSGSEELVDTKTWTLRVSELSLEFVTRQRKRYASASMVASNDLEGLIAHGNAPRTQPSTPPTGEVFARLSLGATLQSTGEHAPMAMSFLTYSPLSLTESASTADCVRATIEMMFETIARKAAATNL